MTTISEFLKGHKYALKAPVRLVYKHDAFTSGRLITLFQSLPDRHLKIRINTLIDGEPISEVDFSAYHLRMCLALLHGVYAGDDPYKVIGTEAGINDRNPAKQFFTIAMGADGRNKALHAGVRLISWHRQG